MYRPFTSILFLLSISLSSGLPAQTGIPLPEHPRPDWERPRWINLNGEWPFRFDSLDQGLDSAWQLRIAEFDRKILVPFPWGSPLSGLEDEADIGWYARSVQTPAGWAGGRVFLVIGAADWRTTAWLDGQKLGEHQGGYTPFEFELTEYLKPGASQRLAIRIDDTPHPFKLEGKQGYGAARGIWQTPYLEVRGKAFLETLHITPDIDKEQIRVEARLGEAAPESLGLRLQISGGAAPVAVEQRIPAGQEGLTFTVDMPDARLWSLDDPFLYEVTATLGDGASADEVHTYFGMRKISVLPLPGTDFRYVALNNRPVYLQLALDQAYHPEGFYTFPSDEFMRNEILRSRQIGLNGMRIHVKVGVPRKLYWADRLGVLIMADVPNSWGEPGPELRAESEYAMRQMIRRDYNHPAIFSWILFNETWGLFTTVDKENKQRSYLPETQEWVAGMYRKAKDLDPGRLVEDNSVCCGVGHIATDLNSWHSYLPGWAWEDLLLQQDTAVYPGSSWNFEPGYRQERQPDINSEFGNVWGYEGSTGDVDWSWDYHRALNVFRRHPVLAGWLYTEHHDVINEWNGYWRFDRSEKITGLDELVPGMSLRDLHAPFFLSTGGDLSRSAKAGETVEVPLYASFLTGRQDIGDRLTLRSELYGWDALGLQKTYSTQSTPVDYRPWFAGALRPLTVRMPEETAVAVLALYLEDAAGRVLHRNFTTFIVDGPKAEEITLPNGRRALRLSMAPNAFSDAKWSIRQWEVLGGLKVNGAGAGYFEYRFPWPSGLAEDDVASVSFLVEASAKQLFGKDRDDATPMGGDYMRGGGTFDPSRNPNAYPMTDEYPSPGSVLVTFNGEKGDQIELPDDPADHRGILSWHSQLRDRRLREAGSYGYRLSVPVPHAAVHEAVRSGELLIRLEVNEALPHGLAIYGSKFGRYPMDPTLLIVLED